MLLSKQDKSLRLLLSLLCSMLTSRLLTLVTALTTVHEIVAKDTEHCENATEWNTAVGLTTVVYVIDIGLWVCLL